MQLTRENDYAVRIVLFLAKIDRSASAGEISGVLKIPNRFTRIILAKLLQSGLVTSQKGINGGYTSAKPDSTLLDAIVAVGSNIAINKCLCEAAGCERIEKEKCVVHHALTALNELIISELRKLKVRELAPGFLLDYDSLSSDAAGAEEPDAGVPVDADTRCVQVATPPLGGGISAVATTSA